MKIKEILARIKALSGQDELTDDEAQELKDLMAKAKRFKAQQEAAELADSFEAGDGDDADDDDSDSDLSPEMEAAIEKAVKAFVGPTTKNPKKVAPNQMKAAQLGDPDPVEDFRNWVRTGEGRIKKHWNREAEIPHYALNRLTGRIEEVRIKAPLQEGTDSEGGYLVPADELGRIIQKREEASLMSRLGVTGFTTDRDVFNVPTEATGLTAFTIVAEEGAISGAQQEPTFAQVAVPIYNFKKLILISEELDEDFNSGLDGFLNDKIGAAWGVTENQYLQVGTGSGQPQGVFVGGTAALTLDSNAAIGPAEIPELMGFLKLAYRQNAVMIMHRLTTAYLAGLRDANEWAFRSAPVTSLMAGAQDLGIGYPVFPTEDAAQIGTTAKTLLFGDFSFYGWVRNRSLRIRRLVELYAGNGQIGLLANFRAGGAVLQAEAFQYATHPV